MPTLADLVGTQTDPTITQSTANNPVVEPLDGPTTVDDVMDRFPEEVYQQGRDSHLYRFLSALAGDSGAGLLKAQTYAARLTTEAEFLNFQVLDTFYAAQFKFKRLKQETYPNYNPSTDSLTPEEWDAIQLADQQYRQRMLDFFTATRYGNSPRGLALAAQAGCGVECEVIENYKWIYDQFSDDPLGVTPEGTTASTAEFVVAPHFVGDAIESPNLEYQQNISRVYTHNAGSFSNARPSLGGTAPSVSTSFGPFVPVVTSTAVLQTQAVWAAAAGTQTRTITPTKGSLLVVVVATDAAGSTTVADNVDGAWTADPHGQKQGSGAVSTFRLEFFYLKNTSGGAKTITATSPSVRGMTVWEITGSDPTNPFGESAFGGITATFADSQPLDCSKGDLALAVTIVSTAVDGRSADWTEDQNAAFGANEADHKISAGGSETIHWTTTHGSSSWLTGAARIAVSSSPTPTASKMVPEVERNVIDLLDRLRPATTLATVTPDEVAFVAVALNGAPHASSERAHTSRLVTGAADVPWPATDPSQNYFIEVGIENEAGTFYGAARELPTVFLTVEGVHAYTDGALADPLYGTSAFYDATTGISNYDHYRSEQFGAFPTILSAIFPFLLNLSTDATFVASNSIAINDTPLVLEGKAV